MKNFSRTKVYMALQWNADNFSFLFCFCQVHRFSTEHWFRWMRNSRFQIHEISLVQEWIIILFYFMLLGALIVLGAKCVWSFVCAVCLCARLGSADLCCCMFASHCATSLLIGDVLTPLELLHTSTDVWRPQPRSKRKRFATIAKIELFFSFEYFCFTKLAVISMTISQARGF